MKTPQQEAQEFYDRTTSQFTAAVLDIVGCKLKPFADSRSCEDAVRHLGDVIVASQSLADMMGRRRLLMEHDSRRARYGLSGSAAYDTLVTPIVPRVDYEEAIRDLVTRDPRLAASAAAVADIYNESHGFALAKSSDVVITEKVQDLITGFLRRGESQPAAQAAIAQLGGWARSYGEVVFRTNVATAYSEGRMAMAKDPDVADFVVGLRRFSARDVDTRPNHRASDGITAPADHPVWRDHGVPAGFQCRCGYDIVDRIQAHREGILTPQGQLVQPRVPMGAYNDQGFTGKLMLAR